MRQINRWSGVVVLSLAVAACQDAAGPESSSPEISARVAGGQGAAQAPGLDELDRAIPGFGGFYFDAQGAPTVFLTDVRGRGAAAQALAARGIDASGLQVREAQYSYRELDRWFGGASAGALEVAGAVYADLQEATNRLEFGVEHPVAAAAVQAVTRRLGIPDGAVTIKQTEPILQVVTLQQRVRPIVAGLQINFPGFLCSIGFNSVDGTQNSFVTASHCTNTQGGVESTPYWQPLQSVDPVQIGTEVEDPVYQRNIPGCPRGRKCRRSDAARVAYASGISFTLGGIARTSGPNNGSLTITGTFSINAEGTAAVGQTVSKIGRTTGWTQGSVSNTCVATGVSGTNIVQLCQTFVNAGVGGGDSGSDVFMGNGPVTLLGVLWGGNGSGTLFVYSPMSGVEQDLGPQKTF